MSTTILLPNETPKGMAVMSESSFKRQKQEKKEKNSDTVEINGNTVAKKKGETVVTEEISNEVAEKVNANESFFKMIDNRTLLQLEEMVESLDKFVDVKQPIDKEVCKKYIVDAHEKARQAQSEASKQEDDLSIEELREAYLKANPDKEAVPNNKKNDVEWLKSKI